MNSAKHDELEVLRAARDAAMGAADRPHDAYYWRNVAGHTHIAIERQIYRAEAAESKLAALRAQIEALEERWRKEWESGACCCNEAMWQATDDLKTVLARDADG